MPSYFPGDAEKHVKGPLTAKNHIAGYDFFKYYNRVIKPKQEKS